MNIEITRGTVLKREVWRFNFYSDYSKNSIIYYSSYSQQHKDTARQTIWRIDGFYDRLNQRDSNIKQPPLPQDVVIELKEQILKEFKNLLKVTIF